MIDWHALFDNYHGHVQRVQQEHKSLQNREPLHPDAYPNAPRVILPGGAHVLMTDEAIVIQAGHVKVRHHKVHDPDTPRPLAALVANGFLLTAEGDTQIRRSRAQRWRPDGTIRKPSCIPSLFGTDDDGFRPTPGVGWLLPEGAPQPPHPAPALPLPPSPKKQPALYTLWITGTLHGGGLRFTAFGDD